MESIKKPIHGVNLGHFGLKLDGLSIPFAITIYLLSSTVVVLYSKPYMIRKILNEYEQVKDDSNSKMDTIESGYSGVNINNKDSQSTLVLSDQPKVIFK